MDPISVTAATIGIADVAFRVGRSLSRLIKGARDVNNDLSQLLTQVDNLISINNSIKFFTCAPDFEQTLRRSFRNTGSIAEPWQQLWCDTARISEETKRLLKSLEDLLKVIRGNDSNIAAEEAAESVAKGSRAGPRQEFGWRPFRQLASSKVDSICTQLRKDSNSDKLRDIRQQLASSQAALDTCLTMINLGWSIKSHQATSDSLTGLRGEFSGCMAQLQAQVSALRQSAPPESPLANKVFQAPAASDLFTGRMTLMNQVAEAFDLVTYPVLHATGVYSEPIVVPATAFATEVPPGQSLYEHGSKISHRLFQRHGRKQKRFILVGLGGSGKTEFCRKFAAENQSSFWGVFWIDATSNETAQHSFKEVSHIGGVDPNTKAAMNWLAGLPYPWLLIIDNADDPNMHVEDYFPRGERGHILVTTRRPTLKHLGNVGEGFSELEKLDEVEARDLLLKHSREETPWTEVVQSLARRIAEVLGYLPLALVCAGKAIAEGNTTLAEYISWFDESWDRIRIQSQRSGRPVDETYKNVFAPYEAMLRSLDTENSQSAQDAVELLKMFSCLHHENISLEALTKAANNPPSTEARLRHEAEEGQRLILKTKRTPIVEKSRRWDHSQDSFIHALTWDERRISYPVLPSVLRGDRRAPFSIHRLRAALTRLTQKSLVSSRRTEYTEIFSMHPLIHRWVRKRPRMSLGERGLWCQAAVTMLNQCIPLPPFCRDEPDVAFRRQLLPHIDAVQKVQHQVQQGLKMNQTNSYFISLVSKSRQLSAFLSLRQNTIDRTKAQQYARFSRLYSESGRFQDAAGLQELVKDYAISSLGLEDERTTHIMLALSGTYNNLGRINDAADLQIQALKTCQYALGPDHPRTLKVMDALGTCEVLRGRFEEARKLHQDALEGMKRVLPSDHQDIFIAMDNLGVVWHRYFQYRKAEELQSQAVAGLIGTLGKDHFDVLVAKENLALTYLEMSLDFGQEISHEQATEDGAESLQKAYVFEYEVLEARRKTLGRENNWTLLAISNLARIKCSLGHLEEAEADLRAGLEIGIRNVGETHQGVLNGKTNLGCVLTAQGRYDEAEEIFQDVIVKGSYDKGSRTEGERPDQLFAVWYYAGCCQLNGKPHKAINLLEGITGALGNMGTTKHPFWDRVEVKLQDLKKGASLVEGDGIRRRGN
ncbi:MAG: hypothetical protein Q9213_004200 [Squamulea squamosa]